MFECETISITRLCRNETENYVLGVLGTLSRHILSYNVNILN